jgi:hypothetical protein
MKTRSLALLLLLGAACSSGSGEPQSQVVTDFLLLDVNQTSPTNDLDVSPRDYVGNVSAWYFGAAT